MLLAFQLKSLYKLRSKVNKGETLDAWNMFINHRWIEEKLYRASLRGIIEQRYSEYPSFLFTSIQMQLEASRFIFRLTIYTAILSQHPAQLVTFISILKGHIILDYENFYLLIQ